MKIPPVPFLKHAISILLGLASFSWLYSQPLPIDGERAWRWELDCEIADSMPKGTVIDLSFETITRAYEVCYRSYSDTLFSRTALGVQDWYVSKGDSMFHTSSNDRIVRRTSRHGRPVAPPTANWCFAGTDTMDVNAVGKKPFVDCVRYMIDVHESGSFVLEPGDTIHQTTAVASIDEYSYEDRQASTIRTVRWFAEGYVEPVAEQTTTIIGTSKTTRLSVCPPSEQGVRQSMAMPGHVSIGPGTAKRSLPATISVESRDGRLFCAEAFSLGECIISVCDTAGRIVRQGEGPEVDTSGLTPGCYLVTVRHGDETRTLKIRL